MNFCVLFSCIASEQEEFLHANELYQVRVYDKAQEIYEKISHKDAAIWYNLGNSYYHENNYIKALAAWERALRQTRGALWWKIMDNQYQVYAALKNQISFHHRIYYSLLGVISYVSMFEFQLIIMLLIFLLFFAILRKRMVVILLLLVLNILAIIAFGLKYHWLTSARAFSKEPITFYAGPDESYHSIGYGGPGELLKIGTVDGSWIFAQGAFRGWVPQQALDII